jgi:hypothetical protein
MGIRSFVRDRKQVKADRAESGSHAALVSAMTRSNPSQPNPRVPRHPDAPRPGDVHGVSTPNVQVVQGE